MQKLYNRESEHIRIFDDYTHKEWLVVFWCEPSVSKKAINNTYLSKY